MRTLTMLVAAAFLAACTGAPPPKAEEPEPKEMTEEQKEEKVDEKVDEAEGTVAQVEVGVDDGGEYAEVIVESDGDNMAYKQTEIVLKANTKTRIKMVNNATTPAMVHNVVIVKKGTGGDVGMAAVTVPREAGHVPAHEGVIAATKLAGPGETTTVVVELPAGEYEFICTFPGHYAIMKGIVKVVD